MTAGVDEGPVGDLRPVHVPREADAGQAYQHAGRSGGRKPAGDACGRGRGHRPLAASGGRADLRAQAGQRRPARSAGANRPSPSSIGCGLFRRPWARGRRSAAGTSSCGERGHWPRLLTPRVRAHGPPGHSRRRRLGRDARGAGGRWTPPAGRRVPARRGTMAHLRVSPARRAAHAALLRAATSRTHVDLTLAAVPELQGLDSRDAGLALELAAGTLKRRGTLDAVIGKSLRPPAEEALARSARGAAPGRLPAALPRPRARPRGGRRERRAGRQAGSRHPRLRQRRAAPRVGGWAQCAGGTHGGHRSGRPGTALLLSSWLAQLWTKEFGARAAAELMEAGNAVPERCLRVNTLAGDWADGRSATGCRRHGHGRGRGVPRGGADRRPAGGARGGVQRGSGDAAVPRLAAGRPRGGRVGPERAPRSPTSARRPD